MRYSLLAAPGDSSPGQIIRGHLHGHLIAGQDPDEVHPQLAGDMGQDGVPVSDVDLKHVAGGKCRAVTNKGTDYLGL